MSTKQIKTNPNKNSFGVKPEDYIYEDDVCFVFDETNNPQAPVHYVVAPKTHIRRLCDATVEDEKNLGRLLLTARRVARDKHLSDGFRVVMNEGEAGMDPGFCVHVLGGRQMGWPFGHLLIVAKNVAVSRGLHTSGYHVVVDEAWRVGALRSLHVFGRALQHMLWPTGPGARL